MNFATILRAVMYNEMTPEVEKFLKDNGYEVERAVTLKSKSGIQLNYTEKELNEQCEIADFYRSRSIARPHQAVGEADSPGCGEPDPRDVSGVGAREEVCSI